VALSSRGLGDLIVDALVRAKLLTPEQFQRASDIAEEEIEARKAVRDYCICQEEVS
jgi:hypothetical protein